MLTAFGHLDFAGLEFLEFVEPVLSISPVSAVMADGQMVASSHQHILMPIW